MTRFMKYYIFSILIGIIAHNNNVSISTNDCDIRRSINNTTILRANRLLLAESTIEENVTEIKKLEKAKLKESKVKSRNRSSCNKCVCSISKGIKSMDKYLHEELEDEFIFLDKGWKNNSIHDITNRKSFKIKVAFSKFMLYYLMVVSTLICPPISLMLVGYVLNK